MSKLKFHNGLAWEALDAANGDSVNGISFRINGGKLQYTTNGSTWYDAGTDTSDATALAGDILSGKTAYVNGIKITGTIPSKGAQTFTPGTTNQTIAANQFLSGIQTIAGDADLTAGNIRYNANLFNVAGTFSYTTSGATAAQIQSGRVAFVNGAQVNGTAPTKSAQTFTPGTTNQTIASGQILTGVQTILGDADLVAGNLKKDVTIFNVTGTLATDYLGAVVPDLQNSGESVRYVDNDIIIGVQQTSPTTLRGYNRVTGAYIWVRTVTGGTSEPKFISDGTYLYVKTDTHFAKVTKSTGALPVIVANSSDTSVREMTINTNYVYLNEKDSVKGAYVYSKSTLLSVASHVNESTANMYADDSNLFYSYYNTKLRRTSTTLTSVLEVTPNDQGYPDGGLEASGTYVFFPRFDHKIIDIYLRSNLTLHTTVTLPMVGSGSFKNSGQRDGLMFKNGGLFGIIMSMTTFEVVGVYPSNRLTREGHPLLEKVAISK